MFISLTHQNTRGLWTGMSKPAEHYRHGILDCQVQWQAVTQWESITLMQVSPTSSFVGCWGSRENNPRNESYHEKDHKTVWLFLHPPPRHHHHLCCRSALTLRCAELLFSAQGSYNRSETQKRGADIQRHFGDWLSLRLRFMCAAAAGVQLEASAVAGLFLWAGRCQD